MRLNTDSKRSPFRCRRLGRSIFVALTVWCGPFFVFGSIVLPSVAFRSCPCCRINANESNAIAAMKMYCTAQITAKKGGYAGGNYATDTSAFSANALLPTTFINAVGPGWIGKEYFGYRFAFVYFRDGTVIDFKTEMPGLCAWPARYMKTAFNSYVIDQSGTVLMKDNSGKPVHDLAEVDSSWVVP